MKKILVLLAFTAILSSCGFNNGRQEDNPVFRDVLEEITSTLSEGQAQPEAESIPAPAPASAPAKEGKWYERDFAIVVTGHTYSMSGSLDKSSDVKWHLTRMGNTVYLHTVEASGTTVDTISEFSDDGKRQVRQYANGALRRSYTDEKTLRKYLDDWLTNEDHAVLGYHPDSDYAQSTGTFIGRPCKIIETEKEENLLGVKKRTTKQYFVDSEYDFLLKVCKSGSGAGLSLNDVVLWEVSSFTDTPTDQNIYKK